MKSMTADLLEKVPPRVLAEALTHAIRKHADLIFDPAIEALCEATATVIRENPGITDRGK